MDLRGLERVWHGLGRRDPYWAALTGRDIGAGGWSQEEFFRTGETEIAAVLRRADQHGWGRLRRRALDFGCGAGRLAQALAAHFAMVDGVDISRSMLAVARRHNRHPDRCRYHHNPAPDLRAFEDNTFDFIYSALTLQHIPYEYSRGYVGELVRVLAPAGLLVFQLPSHRGPVEPDTTTTHTLAGGRLPRSAFLAEISVDQSAMTLQALEKRLLHVTIRNASRQLWPSGARDDGRYRIQVGNRWRTADDAVVVANDGRTPLPHDLQPGGEADVFLEITAPDANGAYRVEIDLVQENVDWFRDCGSSSAIVSCTVEGGGPPMLVRANKGRFRARYPSLHGLLVALGLDVVRGGFRRTVERERVGRWQRASMVMNCIPRREVIALVAAADGQVLDVEQELIQGGFQSCRYWVTKR